MCSFLKASTFHSTSPLAFRLNLFKALSFMAPINMKKKMKTKRHNEKHNIYFDALPSS
jgi:hypothetical protein